MLPSSPRSRNGEPSTPIVREGAAIMDSGSGRQSSERANQEISSFAPELVLSKSLAAALRDVGGKSVRLMASVAGGYCRAVERKGCMMWFQLSKRQACSPSERVSMFRSRRSF